MYPIKRRIKDKRETESALSENPPKIPVRLALTMSSKPAHNINVCMCAYEASSSPVSLRYTTSIGISITKQPYEEFQKDLATFISYFPRAPYTFNFSLLSEVSTSLNYSNCRESYLPSTLTTPRCIESDFICETSTTRSSRDRCFSLYINEDGSTLEKTLTSHHFHGFFSLVFQPERRREGFDNIFGKIDIYRVSAQVFRIERKKIDRVITSAMIGNTTHRNESSRSN